MTSTTSQSEKAKRRPKPEVSIVDEPAIVSPEAGSDSKAALAPLESLESQPVEVEPVEAAPRAKAKIKSGGVAPFIHPEGRLGLRWKQRERIKALRRDGFVALRPAREKRLHRILPRTVIGISTMLMMLGVGAAFSGAAFYAYYDSRLADNEQAVARFVDGFDQQFSDATGAIDRLRTETITDIRAEMAPFGDYVTEANAVIGLPEAVGSSVWLLETLDEDGEVAVGAAFAVIGHEGGTALLTSYSLVESSVVEPSPGIDLIKDSRRIPAQLWSWDVENDVALLVVDEVIAPLVIAGDADQVNAVGTRLFAMSGVGGSGAAASPGVLIDHSSIGLQHTAPVGTLFRGGPLVTSEGKMVGLASLDFEPLGVDGGDVRHAPDMRAVCLVVLECSRVREEVVVEVAEDELQAPLSDGAPVRGASNDDTETDDGADSDPEQVETEDDPAGGE